MHCVGMFFAVLSFRLRYSFIFFFVLFFAFSFVSCYDDCGYALFYCVYFVFVGVFHSHLLHILRSFSGVLAGFTHLLLCYSADSWDLFFLSLLLCTKTEPSQFALDHGVWFRIESNVTCCTAIKCEL